MDGLKRWGENSRALGFEGMGCIHPAQIPVIHAAFAPSPSEIEKSPEDRPGPSRKPQQRGLGVVSLGSRWSIPGGPARVEIGWPVAKAMGLA